MTTIRKFVYAALLAVTAVNFAPSLAAAAGTGTRQIHAHSRRALG